MSNSKPNIVFMGTPGFAVPALKILLDNDYCVKAVVTVADKPAGRGCKILFSEVKQFTLSQNLTILQPEKLKNQEFIDILKEINADVFIVVAFRMLPKEVWSLPKYGTFNLHASLLPNYRGAAPINHAIINGETTTGVTSFFINENIDTGKIILQETCDISETENAGDLHDKLSSLGAEIVLKTVRLIEAGGFDTIEQDSVNFKKVNPAPKITKEFCKINWNDSALKIHNHIRGLSPYPTAFSLVCNDENCLIKIYKTTFILEEHGFIVGKLISDNKSFAKVAVKDGYIFLDEIQMPGKKRLAIKDFLNGFKFDKDYCLQ
jgi:methionyl-tRNA formyltransferase